MAKNYGILVLSGMTARVDGYVSPPRTILKPRRARFYFSTNSAGTAVIGRSSTLR
jgi:hypothetical protein